MEEKKARLLIQSQGDVTLVSFFDQRILDPLAIDEITAELLKLGENTFKAKILVSFEGVEYLSSTVLGKLVALHKKVTENKGALKLCCIKSTIREVFKITKLDRIFEIYDDYLSAINSFKQKKFGM